MSDPFVVVGGDAAGLSAASKCKREDPDREVVVFERGAWVSYAHCGMPYYVGGDVDHISDLLSLSPEQVADRGIDLRRHHEVVAVDTDARTVTVEGPNSRIEQPYADLLVATGARAREDHIGGTDLDGAFTMHSMDAAAAVRAALDDPDDAAAPLDVPYVDEDRVGTYAAWDPPETVAVVGGGYVGVEMVEAFVNRGCDTHLFHRYERPLPNFPDPVGDATAEALREAGATLHLGTPVDRLVGDERVRAVDHAEGRFDVDLAVVGVGIAPNAELVAETPVELGDSGAIAVDEYGETSVEGVYAAGDCAEDRHAVTGASTWVPLGLTANRAGRAVGATVAGDPTPVGDVAGTAAVKAFDLEGARTGLFPEQAAAAGFDPVMETITAGSRSGYYPGAAETTVTLVADRETAQLLGGAIAGTDRAAVRIDTLATAIESGLTVGEVERLDLAYAPPFSPVWDPVLVAAKVLNGALD
ncbi:MAG: FAD-dependent oxidoreductase [Halobacteriaceae archaeon]